MRNETRDMMSLSVSMISIALFAFMLMGIILISRNMFSTWVTVMEENNASLSRSSLNSLVENITEMPVVAVYSILDSNNVGLDSEGNPVSFGEGNIDPVSSIMTIPVSGTEINLREHLSGRCNLEVNSLETGLFQVIIHSDKCSKAESGVCTCR